MFCDVKTIPIQVEQVTACSRTRRLVVVIGASVFLLATMTAQPAASQERAPLVANPVALELAVEAPRDARSTAVFRIAVFRSEDDPQSTVPVAQVDSGEVQVSPGAVRIELGRVLANLADGIYVARVSVEGTTVTLAGPDVTPPFVVFGRNSAAPSKPVSTIRLRAPVEEERHERVWTRVAVAIGAAILLVPLLVR